MGQLFLLGVSKKINNIKVLLNNININVKVFININ